MPIVTDELTITDTSEIAIPRETLKNLTGRLTNLIVLVGASKSPDTRHTTRMVRMVREVAELRDILLSLSVTAGRPQTGPGEWGK